MTDEENCFFEGIGIDQDRVVDDEHYVVNELCCAICQGLLWKPRSCASCQHLFCNQCIRIWLKFNPISCPFRCSPYEEKRAPPHIHSLLGRLSIRCRNSSFGCTKILSYDLLEQHETEECQFSTKQCNICRKYILISEIDQHQMFCMPTTIQCSICKCHVDRTVYRQHTIKCCIERLDRLIEQMMPSPDDFEMPENNTFTFPQELGNATGFTQLNNGLQRFLSLMPKMAFSLSTKSMGKGSRSNSTIRTAIARDYDRKKLATKLEVKLERDYDTLERKMMSRAKWNQRAENNNLRSNPTTNHNNNQDRSTISLEHYIQREKIKQENIINAKRMGNERIRRSSVNTLPKV
ncbi:unnamed protein product [Rotaria sp. Silwood1]|nr:unnamed protein product [Rotaria sp. Silwood1]CAF3457604.1 unnamed protein product [Rotaria sp. Silwood1]CAF3486374.1 unnamed protein product [Rotaria sp. Silwood1]CAF4529745.1 unnamed protein product [Rotaria sp. Silwood1]